MKRIVGIVLAFGAVLVVGALQREDAADAALRMYGARGPVVFLKGYVNAAAATTETVAARLTTVVRVTNFMADASDFRDVFTSMTERERDLAIPVLRSMIQAKMAERRGAITKVEDEITSGLEGEE